MSIRKAISRFCNIEHSFHFLLVAILTFLFSERHVFRLQSKKVSQVHSTEGRALKVAGISHKLLRQLPRK